MSEIKLSDKDTVELVVEEALVKHSTKAKTAKREI